jgi:hypothetical protein
MPLTGQGEDKMDRPRYIFLIAVVIIAFCITALVSCKKKESPFQSELPMDNATITITPAPEGIETAEPVIIEQGEQKLGVVPPQTTPTSTETTTSGYVTPTPNQVQTALKNAGYYEGNIDGKIGPKSKKAITNFQIDNGLEADGKVGPKTWARLKAHLEAKKQ